MEIDGRKAIQEYHRKKMAAQENIVKVARPLIAVLKDHSATNSASELEAAFFVMDALDQEFTETFIRNPEGMITALVEILEKK